jgi:group I intron endonuclease
MQGIYEIKNKINNKVYIGQSNNIEWRWQQHGYLLNNYKSDSIHLQHAWDKYGSENFEFSILEEVLDLSLLNEKEIYWINFKQSYLREFGYNISGGGGNTITSEETKQKISQSLKGKFAGEKHHLYGKKHSEETKEKIRQAQIGKKHTEESKKKIGEKSKLNKHTEETKQKISNSHKGKEKSEETKQKISESKKGRIPWNKGKKKGIDF